ncbi:unnamed protein product [Pleuronectes platessa]|uniref:Uncharacterized protein n=1 Tax=Pleuronectes platessa TaxID=8262 RepID=A0A9N7VHK4_PLEPL|nr:unnamed protein product [Pleuronectes platessa]
MEASEVLPDADEPYKQEEERGRELGRRTGRDPGMHGRQLLWQVDEVRITRAAAGCGPLSTVAFAPTIGAVFVKRARATPQSPQGSTLSDTTGGFSLPAHSLHHLTSPPSFPSPPTPPPQRQSSISAGGGKHPQPGSAQELEPLSEHTNNTQG